jgi:Protein of unknown function (DUF2934)
MAQKSRSDSDPNGSPKPRPTSSEAAGADLTRSIAGNVIERHGLVQGEPGSGPRSADPQPSNDPQREKSPGVGPADIGSQVAAEDSAKQKAAKRRSAGSPMPGTAEVATEQAAGSLEAIQQGGQMRDIGSQAPLDSGASDAARAPASIANARYHRIAIAAYYRAERRGFEPGHEIEDWLEAEREVAEREGGGAIG